MESYEMELQLEVNFLYSELIFVEEQIEAARKDNDGKEYARLMRLYLPMQKNYLKLRAEQEAAENAEQGDSLLAFAGNA